MSAWVRSQKKKDGYVSKMNVCFIIKLHALMTLNSDLAHFLSRGHASSLNFLYMYLSLQSVRVRIDSCTVRCITIYTEFLSSPILAQPDKTLFQTAKRPWPALTLIIRYVPSAEKCDLFIPQTRLHVVGISLLLIDGFIWADYWTACSLFLIFQ